MAGYVNKAFEEHDVALYDDWKPKYRLEGINENNEEDIVLPSDVNDGQNDDEGKTTLEENHITPGGNDSESNEQNSRTTSDLQYEKLKRVRKIGQHEISKMPNGHIGSMVEPDMLTTPLLDEPTDPEMWNAFREIPEDFPTDTCDRFFRKAAKCCKVFTVFLCFIVLLGSIVVSQGTVMYMAANIKPTSPLLCQNFLDIATGRLEISCVVANNSTVLQQINNLWENLDLNSTLPNDTFVSTTATNTISMPNDSMVSTFMPNDSVVSTFMPDDPTQFTTSSSDLTTIDTCASLIPECIFLRNENDTLIPIGCVYQSESCVSLRVRWLWCICLVLITPNFFVFIRCLWIFLFKKTGKPRASLLILALVVETLHHSGLCIIGYGVLPRMPDSLHCLTILSSLTIIPSLLQIFNRKFTEKCKVVKTFLDILVFICQICVMVYIILNFPDPDGFLIWSIPLGLVLTSIGWWENYVEYWPYKRLKEIKHRLYETKSRTYLLCSFWKICVSILLILPFSETGNVSDIFDFSSNFERCLDSMGVHQLPSTELDWVFVWLTHTGAGILAYFIARFAAKADIQRGSYALPIIMATPVTFLTLVLMCAQFNSDTCSLPGLPTYSFFNCYKSTWYSEDHWLLCVSWISFCWVTRHLWFPPQDRLAKTDRLFLAPLYEGIILEQSLALNRRSNMVAVETLDTIPKLKERMAPKEEAKSREEEDQFRPLPEDQIPHVYVSATMWHETEYEMVQLLKSIYRMDLDQWARKRAIDEFKIKDPDYYTFEGHIFFDDVINDKENHEYKPNQYVELFVKTVDKAANAFYEWDDIDGNALASATRIETPYGVRMEWMMLGGNKLVAHLKDKKRIRHKKRWSQVMYMYYFLGWQLMQCELNKLGWNRLTTRADKTFILALDGDVDFQPEAVTLLIDRMKKDSNIAAACGRVHPIGSGPMVWYQKFEYALGHWMQKATEHVLGCVLCTPGCFSLFRGSCLMDENVIRRYATLPTEARHYVQYDQGEDRWLCTLLLKQGYRVEYSAASDSYTYCPESFDEFYNQRRRWMPSTWANIFDLLSSWRMLVTRNENISSLYMIYQAVMTIWALLGTGSIFLLIVGAFDLVVFFGNPWESFFINLAPLAVYVAICLLCKTRIQLRSAAVLSAWYVVLQMMVLVSIIVQMADEGVESPTAIFFFYVAGTYVLAALLHPREFFDVIHGFIYFVAIPSMYMLLMIYVVANINNVSWGTREVKVIVPEETKNDDEDANDPNMKGTWMGLITRTAKNVQRRLSKSNEKSPLLMDVHDEETPAIQMRRRISRWTNENWINHPSLGNGPTGQLEEDERKFFDRLIEEYLAPVNETKMHKLHIEAELNELRNSVMIAYVLLNAIFVVTVFTLQLNADLVSIPWPFGEDLAIEPIGFMFLAFFVFVMVIQTLGMIAHRLGTLQHVVATTKMNCCRKKESGNPGVQDVIAATKEMAHPTQDEDESLNSEGGTPKKRDAVYKLQHKKTRKIIGRTLSQAFDARSEALNRGEKVDDVMGSTIRKQRRNRNTIRALFVPQETLHELSNLEDESSGSRSTATSNVPLKEMRNGQAGQRNHNIQIQIGGVDFVDDMSFKSDDNWVMRTPLKSRSLQSLRSDGNNSNDTITERYIEEHSGRTHLPNMVNSRSVPSFEDELYNGQNFAAQSWQNLNIGNNETLNEHEDEYDAPLTPTEIIQNQFLQVTPSENVFRKSSSDTYLHSRNDSETEHVFSTPQAQRATRHPANIQSERLGGDNLHLSYDN